MSDFATNYINQNAPFFAENCIKFLYWENRPFADSIEKEREHLRVLLDQEQHLHAQTRLRLNQYEGDTTQGTEGEQPKEETDTNQEPKKKRNRFMRWLFGEE